jgi:hypothetical protein
VDPLLARKISEDINLISKIWVLMAWILMPQICGGISHIRQCLQNNLGICSEYILLALLVVISIGLHLAEKIRLLVL